MPLFGLVWATSWVNFFLTSGQILKVPDYLVNTFPNQVFSIVNSPIELATPLFSKPLATVVLSSKSSVATLPNLVFWMNTGVFQEQSIQAFAHPSVPVAVGENTFCYQQASEQKKDSVQVASQTQMTSSLRQQPSVRNDSKSTFSQQIWQLVQNLLPGLKRNETVKNPLADSIKLVSTHSGTIPKEQQGAIKPEKKGPWQYSQQIKKLAVASTSKKQELFQVWLKNKLIGQFPQQQQAELMAQQLKQVLLTLPKAAEQSLIIEPSLDQGLPALKIGDRLLFKIDAALAKALNQNPELIAIDWINNLRLALGKTPLPLAEAQRKMYQLVATSKTFQGSASWYGTFFHGRQTATGETYDKHELTAAHPTLPFDTYLKVKNRKNGHSIVVRVNDRGPFVPDRNLDLSQEAARCLNSEKAGIVPFEAVVLQPAANKVK
jgi:rare lipoprotein A